MFYERTAKTGKEPTPYHPNKGGAGGGANVWNRTKDFLMVGGAALGVGILAKASTAMYENENLRPLADRIATGSIPFAAGALVVTAITTGLERMGSGTSIALGVANVANIGLSAGVIQLEGNAMPYNDSPLTPGEAGSAAVLMAAGGLTQTVVIAKRDAR